MIQEWLEKMKDAVQNKLLFSVKNVIYYALDYKYTLFETNKDEIARNKSSLPRLVFVCANNHLYPITDEEKRETIFKSCSKVGGSIKKYRTQQQHENKNKNETETQIYVMYEDMSFYGLLEHVKKNKE